MCLAGAKYMGSSEWRWVAPSGLRSVLFLARIELSYCGEVPERSNGAVSKTVVPLTGDRGFESLPLRSCDVSGTCANVADSMISAGLIERLDLMERSRYRQRRIWCMGQCMGREGHSDGSIRGEVDDGDGVARSRTGVLRRWGWTLVEGGADRREVVDLPVSRWRETARYGPWSGAACDTCGGEG